MDCLHKVVVLKDAVTGSAKYRGNCETRHRICLIHLFFCPNTSRESAEAKAKKGRDAFLSQEWPASDALGVQVQYDDRKAQEGLLQV